jgi:energy-converting hydrogenase A subunit C
MNDLLLGVCMLVALYAVIRIILEKEKLKKLLFLNVLGFSITGALILILPHPLTIAAAAAFFVGSTLESNAIASTIAKREGGND